MTTSAFAETEYVDEKRNFSITLPDGWIVGEKPRLENGWMPFLKDGDMETYSPTILVFYEKNIPLMVTSKSELNSITSSKNLKDVFKRTISRLYELTSIKY